nr:hypothetical protein [Tanacetum cinerariifolium]
MQTKEKVDLYLNKGKHPTFKEIADWTQDMLCYFKQMWELMYKNESANMQNMKENKEEEEDVYIEKSRIAMSMEENELIFASFIYAANGQIDRKKLWADSNRYKQITNGKPWFIGGYTNVILTIAEHSAGGSFNTYDMQEFRDCTNMIEVEHLCSSSLYFTWKKNLKKVGKNGNLFDKVEKLKSEVKRIQIKVDQDPHNKPLRDIKAIMKEINSLLMGFLWCNDELSRGKAKVTWKKVCKRNSHGGLGLKDLEVWNKSLVVKHIKGYEFWEAKVDVNDSWGWKNLLDIKNEIKGMFGIRLGMVRTPLCGLTIGVSWVLYSRQYQVEVYIQQDSQGMVVADMACNGEWLWPSDWIQAYPDTNHPAFTVKLSPTKPDQDLSHTNRPSSPIIEDWVSDSEDESKTKKPQNVLSFVQSTEQVKSPRPFVQHVKTSIPAATPKPTSPKPTSNGKRRNRKACFVCKSLDHLIKDCDYHEKKMAQPAARNHAHRGNHKQYAPMKHPNSQRHMDPTTVLTQTKPVPITAVRLVSTVVHKISDCHQD